jgi:hypothetical protein
MQQKYVYLNIPTFALAYKRNRQYCKSVDELVQVIENNKNMKGRICHTSIYEVLEKDIRRVYFDIEKIPFERKDMIYDIIKRLAEFLEIDPNDYALTLNTGSRLHPGLSYHLTFPYKTLASNILNLVRTFKLKYPEYTDYIDEAVYSKDRLFRMPDQYGIDAFDEFDGELMTKTRRTKVKVSDTNNDGNKSTPLSELLSAERKAAKRKRKDVHRIKHGVLKDLIIQNINDIPMLGKIFKCVPRYKLPTTRTSLPAMSNTVMDLLGNIIDIQHDMTKENMIVSRQKYKFGTFKEITYVVLLFIMIVILMFK